MGLEPVVLVLLRRCWALLREQDTSSPEYRVTKANNATEIG